MAGCRCKLCTSGSATAPGRPAAVFCGVFDAAVVDKDLLRNLQGKQVNASGVSLLFIAATPPCSFYLTPMLLPLLREMPAGRVGVDVTCKALQVVTVGARRRSVCWGLCGRRCRRCLTVGRLRMHARRVYGCNPCGLASSVLRPK